MKEEKHDLVIRPMFRLGEVRSYEIPPPEVSNEDVALSLGRHLIGDWGDVTRDLWDENNDALHTTKGGVVRSFYNFPGGYTIALTTDLDEPRTLLEFIDPYEKTGMDC